MAITVTVIWNDFTSEGDNAYVEVVEIEECADGKYHIEAIIRKAMEKSGYDNKLISEAFDRSYGLIGIIKGEVEWLA